jgi:hypothetical protein
MTREEQDDHFTVMQTIILCVLFGAIGVIAGASFVSPA